MFVRQFRAIQAKNWTINIRNREFIRENVSVMILAAFIVISQRTNPNAFTTPFYLSIAITSYSRAVATWWLQEKETHQKELQSIMGLSYLSYLFSWLFYFLINGLLIAAIMLLVTFGFVITDQTVFAQGYGPIDLVPLYLLFVVSNLGYVLFFCCFFSKAKTGAQAITFIQLITTFLYFLRFSQDLSNNAALISFLSIFPQMTFNMAISKISFIFPGYTFDFSYSQAIVTLIVITPIYILLALYLEQVIPSELGTHKHPLFFLGFGKHPHQELPLHERLLQGQNNQEQKDSSAKYEQKVERAHAPLIKVRNIIKDFGQQRVINDLSVNFYGGQIFCLLGHNGAGKSTTINLLTGLLKKTSGEIDILGMRYPQDVDEIRKNIGLCLQYNVLYDVLTVEDHLRFYYRIKNQDDSLLDNAVEKTIMECALDTERGKLAKNLSGGNKRKLCLANSLIGGSKIIFLDQPSSGLDPNSRQTIWGILKNISHQDRCIILTTHHLEEAQELSRRIGIMSKGQLIILGSTEFITRQFSVGYHAVITLNKENPNAASTAREIITKGLARCTEDKQTAKNTLKFVLPLSELPKFAKTFKLLEEADVGQVSVYVSNLQDAFVKIGEEQDNFTEGFQQLNSSTTEELSSRKQQQVLVLPAVSCTYSFWSQFKGVFKRKARTVLRSFSTIVSIIMPSIFMSVGAIVVCVAIPNNETDPVNFVTLDRIRLYILSYFMVWAFIFNTSSYCGSIVLEREKRFKYLSNVSGIRQFPYWAANYAFDLIIFVIPLGIFFIVIACIGQQANFVTRFAGLLVSMLVLFAFSFIGYSYLFSFIFQKSSTAFRFFPFINLLFFYFLPNIPMLVDAQSFLAQYLMPLLTPFVAFSSFFNTEEVAGSAFGQTLAYNKLYASYLALSIQAVVYCVITLRLEKLRFSLKNTRNQEFIHELYQNQGQNLPNPAREPDLRESFEHAPIKVSRLSKIYGNGKVAIRDNSFCVGEGEIFGLLGPNGAGKSTSFNIITAALPKSSGSVKLFDQEVNKGIMSIFQQVGVCPQYNPLYEKLTVKEHLEYFAYVKGLSNQEIQPTIAFYAELLSLKPYMNVQAAKLSGGNKRKMCVAMAMIGSPNVAFFDEPSAGVDPISRRFLWKCLSASTSTRKTAMVLTTHSMNEAESLCSRIGILINGQFVCLDTPKALKEQYGKGYRVNVVCDPEVQPRVYEIVKAQFGQEVTMQRLQSDIRRVVFVIKTENFSLWRAFDLFENKLKKDGQIEHYEVKESTLEEVFIFLSRLQPVVQEEHYAEPWQLLCWEWGTNGCELTI